MNEDQDHSNTRTMPAIKPRGFGMAAMAAALAAGLSAPRQSSQPRPRPMRLPSPVERALAEIGIVRIHPIGTPEPAQRTAGWRQSQRRKWNRRTGFFPTR